jgi:hypothetical protein
MATKTVNSLLIEMKAVFGQTFGREPLSLLSEADPFAKDNKKQLQAVKAEPKTKSDRNGKDVRYRNKKRSDKHMSDFYNDAEKRGTVSAARPKPSKAQFHGSGKHYPFRRSGMLGKGPGTPPGERKVHGAREHDEKHCWHCTCGNIYTAGCTCVGTGATKDCPRGRRKPIHIKKAYRKKYNKLYHTGYSHDLHRWSEKTAKGKAFSKYGPNR